MRTATTLALTVLAGLTLVALVAGCTPAPPTPPTQPFSFEIDDGITPVQPTLLGPAGERTVVALQDAEGRQYDFIADEVIVLPTGQAQLDAFMARHQGVVVGDYQEDGAERTVVVRVTTAGIGLDRLVEDADAAGVPGAHRFSSEAAARLMALVVREQRAGLKVASNGLAQPQQPYVMLTAQERAPLNPFEHDAFASPIARPRVVEAWQYMAARRLAGPLRRVRVAIIDGGFHLDSGGSSFPDGNGMSDLPASPAQHDFVSGRIVISGTNAASCSGDTACPWHGHGSASVAAGTLDNGAYAAGTGGQVVDPILLNVDLSAAQVKAAIDAARAMGAEVINMSFGGACNAWCRLDRDIAGYYLAFERAHAAGIVMVASAGNAGLNAGAESYHPCVVANVLCIGALGTITPEPASVHLYDNRAIGYSNHGAAVHLWAPTRIPAWYGTGAVPDVATFGGTSASAPYVSGVVAMMKSVDPGLSPAQVRSILLETARTDSPDPKVTRSLDAFAAVRRAAGHRLPPDRFEPNDSGASARTLAPGSHPDLTIDRGNDADFYRVLVAGPTNATLGLTYPGGLGRMALPPYGRETTQSCGVTEQVSYAHVANGLHATYRLSSGAFVFSANSPGNPLPYHLDLSLASAPIVIDAYDAASSNGTFATATNVGDGGYVGATLHTVSDVDFYRVYSYGAFSTSVLSMTSRVSVESADVPLTLRLHDSSGNVIATSTSSANCASQASLVLPAGFQTVSVLGSSVGAYRLWLGSYGEQHPLVDVGTWLYLILNPSEPVEFIVRDPAAWFVIDHNSDAPLAGLELEGAGLHLRLYDEAGTMVLAEGVDAADRQGQVLSLTSGQGAERFLLQVSRVEPIVAGAELPVIPGRLTSLD